MTKTLHGRFSQRLPFNRCAGIAVTTMTSTQLKTDARIFNTSLREIPAGDTLKNLACILLPLDHIAHFVCLGAEMTSAKNSSALKFYSVNTSINCLRMLWDDALSLVPTKRRWQMNRFSECAWSEPPVQVLDIVSRNTRPSVLLNVENADSSARVTENQRQKLSGKTSWRRNGGKRGKGRTHRGRWRGKLHACRVRKHRRQTNRGDNQYREHRRRKGCHCRPETQSVKRRIRRQ